MRVLVTGGAGLLGRALIAAAPPGVELHATERSTPVAGVPAHRVDLADDGAAAALWRTLRPDVVIHAAYGNDDGARDIESATRNVVDACRAAGAALVHLSTEAVLAGDAAPYDETAAAAPVHQYGRWKASAEAYVRAHLPSAAVIRTALIVQADPPDATSADLLARIARGERPTRFVDELRCPIAAADLAAQLWEIVALPAADRAGTWNLAGPEAVSRYALGLLVAARHGIDASRIIPNASSASPAPRPRDLRLSTARADRTLRTRARGVSEVLALPTADAIEG